MEYRPGRQAPIEGYVPQVVFRYWIHSREEDVGDVEVFRPEGFTFPPAHGRDGFEMRGNGQFIQEDIGPADQPVRTIGRWTSPGHGMVLVFFDGAERGGFSFKIVNVDEHVLRREELKT